MNFLKKSNLLLFLVIPAQISCMKADVAYERLVKDVKALPRDIKVEIFKYKCAQLCPKLIEEAQTLPELKELFKSFIILDRDFRTSQLFHSILFKLLEMKKYKILFEIALKLKYAGIVGHDDILNEGINIKDKDSYVQGTRLHRVIYEGRKYLAELLIKNGADVNLQDNDKWSSLHIAVDVRRKEIVELLLESGADINARDVRGRTPLHLAMIKGSQDIADKSKRANKIIELLKAHGAHE